MVIVIVNTMIIAVMITMVIVAMITVVIVAMIGKRRPTGALHTVSSRAPNCMDAPTRRQHDALRARAVSHQEPGRLFQ
jgi:hypothetical protein